MHYKEKTETKLMQDMKVILFPLVYFIVEKLSMKKLIWFSLEIGKPVRRAEKKVIISKAKFYYNKRVSTAFPANTLISLHNYSIIRENDAARFLYH